MSSEDSYIRRVYNKTEVLSSKITIIVPVFNEEENIHQFVEEMDKYLKETTIPSQVLFVNDGSVDKSQSLIEEVCENNSSFIYLQLAKNCGLSSAIKAGIDYCNTEWIAYIDSDIQTKPIDFIKFFQYLPDYEMVNGIRAKRKDTVVKKLSSIIANNFRRMMINDGIEDTCCPLKIIKTENAKQIPFFDGMHRFIPALIQLQGGKVKQVEIPHYPRYAGTAKYNLWNRLRKPFFDTFAYRWMRSRYIHYHIKDQG